jgi:ATP-dependent Lon protease
LYAGLTHFLLLRKNEKDLAEVPKRLLRGIELVLVDRVSQALDAVLLPAADEEA